MNIKFPKFAEIVTLKGYGMGILALIATVGQMESSIYFNGCIEKPLIESTVVRLMEMTIDASYKVLLDVPNCEHEY